MSENKEPPATDMDDALAEVQLRKARLEIAELERKQKWYNKFLAYLPLITTIVAVVGVLLAMAGFLADKEKERAARVEEQRLRDEGQIRINIDQLLNLDEKQPTAKVAYLLDDLVELIKRKPAEQQKESEKRVTEAIVRFISRDAELLTIRFVRIDRYAIEHWPGYKGYLEEHPDENAFILDNYIEAFTKIYKQDEEYFSKIIDYQRGGFDIGTKRRTDSALFFWFGELVHGFAAHLKMSGMKKEDIRIYIEVFQAEINNPTITQHLIDEKVFPDPGEISKPLEQPLPESTRRPSVRSRAMAKNRPAPH